VFVRLCLLVSCLLPAAPVSAQVLIHEFSPRPAGGEGEWIELRNPGAFPVGLDGWTVEDATERRRELPRLDLVPGAYIVLAARPDSLRARFAIPPTAPVERPSGWPTLNDNDGSGGAPADWIVLRDASGAVRDSVAYFASWLPAERGRSVERVAVSAPSSEPGSWGWSLDPAGATPGRANSLESGDGPGGPAETGEALTGPEVVDPGTAPAVFRYRFPGPGRLGVWLLDGEGREMAVLRAPEAAPAAGRWVWGPQTPAAPRAGPYVLCLRWQGESGRRTACRRVWVAS
jgi:hypothetical protein